MMMVIMMIIVLILYLLHFRGEALKKALQPTPNRSQASPQRTMPPLGFNAFSEDDDGAPTRQRPTLQVQGPSSGPGGGGKRGPINVGPSSYSRDEIAVLRCVFYAMFLCEN